MGLFSSRFAGHLWLLVALVIAPQTHAARGSTRSWELVDLKAPEKVSEDKQREQQPPPRKDLTTGKLSKAEYAPYRTQTPVMVDGILDDEAWLHAIPDRNFYSRVSNPYGQPTTEPTQIQVAYDDRAIYVAFKCGYAGPGERDNALPENEMRGAQYSEAVSVQVDARNSGSNALSFQITRSGFQIDVQMSNNGEVLNWDWHGLWFSATHVEEDGSWTAEFALPWGTIGPADRDGPFDVRINFRRKVPSRDSSVWALMPPAFLYYTPVSFFGRLKGIRDISPDQLLFIAPYLTIKHTGPLIPVPPLRHFVGLDPIAHLYGGVLIRAKPTSGVRLDIAMNPDFTLAPPDAALVTLDRFELQYPEVRDFFTDERTLFEVGRDNFQLFYSRRLGQRKAWLPTTRGDREEVPIFGAAKAVIRSGGLEVGGLNVFVPRYDDGRLNQFTLKDFDQNVSVLRVNHLWGRRTHLGALLINRAVPTKASAMSMIGADGEVSLLDEHLFVSTFDAYTRTAGAKPGFLAHGRVDYVSEQFQAYAFFIQVDRDFDPTMSFLEQTGIRQAEAQASYLPRINSDAVKDVILSATVTRRATVAGAIVYDRVVALARADLLDWAEVDLQITHSTDAIHGTLFGALTLAGGRYQVADGQYDSLVTEFKLRTAPQKLVEIEAGYADGNFFGGYRRSPSFAIRLNTPVLIKALYELQLVQNSVVSITGHRISGLVRYAPIQPLQMSLIVEVNTFDIYSKAQAAITWRFGTLSQLAFVSSLNNFAGGTARLQFDAGLTFTYGIAAL